jgi:hypothetical protein
MANYFESGFTMLKELAAEKQKQNNLNNDVKKDVCGDDKKCTQRLIDAMSDCD